MGRGRSHGLVGRCWHGRRCGATGMLAARFPSSIEGKGSVARHIPPQPRLTAAFCGETRVKLTLTAFVYKNRHGNRSGGTLVHRGSRRTGVRSEEHTSELQSLMRISYAVFCLKKKKNSTKQKPYNKAEPNEI